MVVVQLFFIAPLTELDCSIANQQNLIAVGTESGSVLLFDKRKIGTGRCEINIESGGHGEGVEITDVGFSPSGNLFSTRGLGDGVVKLWDKRKVSGRRQKSPKNTEKY